MAKAKKQVGTNTEFFNKENYILMLAGLVLLAIGVMLMIGGKSTDPKVFDPKEVYSPMRIKVAPILMILGFIIEIFAIMKRPKKSLPSESANN